MYLLGYYYTFRFRVIKSQFGRILMILSKDFIGGIIQIQSH